MKAEYLFIDLGGMCDRAKINIKGWRWNLGEKWGWYND